MIRVLIDEQELPSGIDVDLVVRKDRPSSVHIRFPVTSDYIALLARFADGQVHTIEWYSDQGLVARAQGKLQCRLTVKTGSAEQSYYELFGEVWGPPPNYDQVFVIPENDPQGE